MKSLFVILLLSTHCIYSFSQRINQNNIINIQRHVVQINEIMINNVKSIKKTKTLFSEIYNQIYKVEIYNVKVKSKETKVFRMFNPIIGNVNINFEITIYRDSINEIKQKMIKKISECFFHPMSSIKDF